MNAKELNVKVWFSFLSRSPHLFEVVASYSAGLLFLTATCFLYYNISFYDWVVLSLLGTMFYTFIEYWFHRVVLHELLAQAHRNHHRQPKKLRIITTPILPVYMYNFLVVLVLRSILGAPVVAAINCGVTLGQITMDLSHIAFHSNFRPWYLESARSYHLHHHFSKDDLAHGLTTSFWDMIFGTLPSRWPAYQKHPWLRYLQLPFPLLTFIITALLTNTKSNTKVVHYSHGSEEISTSKPTTSSAEVQDIKVDPSNSVPLNSFGKLNYSFVTMSCFLFLPFIFVLY